MNGQDVLRTIAPVLNSLEDGLHWLFPRSSPWPMRLIWAIRGYLSEGRARRLLRKAVKVELKHSYMSQHLFSGRELGMELGDRCISVIIERKPMTLMTGHDIDG